jgi:hypothetical protein
VTGKEEYSSLDTLSPPGITRQLEYIRAWGGEFVTAVPRIEVA